MAAINGTPIAVRISSSARSRPGPFGRSREQGERVPVVLDRLDVGEPLRRALGGPTVMIDGLLGEAGQRAMMGEHLRVVGIDVRERPLERGDDPRVQLASPAAQQGLVGGVAQERVPERIGLAATAPEQAGGHQLLQSLAEQAVLDARNHGEDVTAELAPERCTELRHLLGPGQPIELRQQ